MYKGIVVCRAGMGSSMLLKIKADQVINEKDMPIALEHGNLDSLIGYRGDLVLTLSDLTNEIKDQVPDSYCAGVMSITNKDEIEEKLNEFLAFKNNKEE